MRRLVRRGELDGDAGMATAEYALVTLAAAAFAGLLLVVLSGGEVRGLLLGIITRALG
ncbi:MAG: DUF4244 domain-containing protein [Micrococcales bacterium]|nr:DUF4244 domain-containing protein [Micrococcales bacterium]MCL2668598.1 DUF4244 domain-containing protein [Micrococcales bacterium]